MKKKIIGKSALVNEINKPSTVARAGLTAETKYTRGKQLVEHIPSSLIPDPHNPRPGEIIDDNWLKQHLLLGTKECLSRINEETGQFEIPDILNLDVEVNENLIESYNFLRDLA